MKKTLIVVSTNRGLFPETLQAVRTLRNAGARLVQQEGATDVTLARNHALSMAVVALQSEQGKDIDTILMLDDDMVFTLHDALHLVDRTRQTGAPASGLYVQAGGTLAASRMPSSCAERSGAPALSMRPGSWHVGLGFLAFPASTLLRLAAVSQRFSIKGQENWEFVYSGAVDGAYISEDFCWSRRLGGVELLPLEVGHLKSIPLYPNAKQLEQVGEIGKEWSPDAGL